MADPARLAARRLAVVFRLREHERGLRRMERQALGMMAS
jgi:hypothetical protein